MEMRTNRGNRVAKKNVVFLTTLLNIIIINTAKRSIKLKWTFILPFYTHTLGR